MLIYTDSSFEHNLGYMNRENVAGTDIYLIFDNNEHQIVQIIGNKGIISAERHALAIIPEILSKLNLYHANRIIIATDNLPTFYTIYRSNKTPL